MDFIAPRTCSASTFKAITDNTIIDADFVDRYFGCPISTRTVTRMSPGSFERACRANQKKLEENRKTDGRFILAKPTQICSTCSIGKKVMKGESIIELPKSFMIEIYDFGISVTSIKSQVEIKKPKGRNKPRKLNMEIAKNIREDRKNGLKLRELGEKYHLSVSRIKDIVYNKIWVSE